jgi:hypothetical protein
MVNKALLYISAAKVQKFFDIHKKIINVKIRTDTKTFRAKEKSPTSRGSERFLYMARCAVVATTSR